MSTKEVGGMSERVFVETCVGRLSVDLLGEGRPTVLWQSLFVDERSWQRLVPLLPHDRQLVLITGPGHGASRDLQRRYSLADCARAATEVLDALKVCQPVDWVGNAFGGHVGIRFATAYLDRIRSLTTISTPIRPLSLGERSQMRAMLLAHLIVGPVGFIVDGVVEAMLAPATRAQDPEAVALLRECVVGADRRQLRNAVRSISLHREDLTPLLTGLAVPTLMLTGADDEGWPPTSQEAAIAHVPDGRAAVVPDAAYLPPLEQPASVATFLLDFWSQVEAQGQRIER